MMLNPQVGKSGVNHRLRKLSEIADELRNDKEEVIMIKKPVTIQLSTGLEARPVAQLVQVAASLTVKYMLKSERKRSMQRALWV